jgi:hypothetical protein
MIESDQLVASVVPVEAVVRLAQKVPVFPCRRSAEEVTLNGRSRILKPKSPLTARGFLDATTDPDRIRTWWRRWPDALVGVPTGAITGLLVVDFDLHKADESAKAWVTQHTDWLLQTRAHATLNGGRHYLFKLPPGQQYGSGVNVRLAGAQRIGIDIRCDGGYIIWWPLHGGSLTGEVAPLPAGLIEERRLERRELPPLAAHSPHKWERERQLVAQALAWLDPSDYDEWIHAGMAIHLASGNSEDGFQLWHSWSAGEITGEVPTNYSGEADCRAHWASFTTDRERENTKTLGSVFANAKRAGWERVSSAAAPSSPAVEAEDAPTESEKIIEPTIFEWLDPTTIPPRQWLYGRHYMRGMVSATAGIGGAGKSSVLIVEAISMAIGRDLLHDGQALTVGPIKVWLHNGEDPMEELQRRFAAAMQHYGVTKDDLGDRLRVTSGRDTPIMVAEVLADGGRLLVPTEHGRLLGEAIKREEIAVFIADPFVTLHRVNENDNVMVDGVMTIIRNLAHETGCAIELAHHFRKLGTADASVDDVRGASSIIGACRSVRIVSQMTKEEGERYGLPDDERRSYIWLQNGKANMLPPIHARRWMHMTSVDLGNAAPPFASDKVGVPQGWEPPESSLTLTSPEFRAVRTAIRNIEQPINALRYDLRASGWVGRLIAKTLELDVEEASVRYNIKATIERWIQQNTLAVKTVRDPRQARSVQIVEWVEQEGDL